MLNVVGDAGALGMCSKSRERLGGVYPSIKKNGSVTRDSEQKQTKSDNSSKIVRRCLMSIQVVVGQSPALIDWLVNGVNGFVYFSCALLGYNAAFALRAV